MSRVQRLTVDTQQNIRANRLANLASHWAQLIIFSWPCEHEGLVCVCVYSIVPLAHAVAIISRVNHHRQRYSLLSGTGAVYAATRMQITLHGFYHIAKTHTHTLPLSQSCGQI